MVSTEDILKKYGRMIEKKMGSSSSKFGGESYSKSYLMFKQEMAPNLSRYEKWCKTLGSVIKLKISKKEEEKVKKQLQVAHLDVEPWQALTLSVMAFLSVFLIGLLISIAIPLISGDLADFPILFFVLMLLLSMFLFYYFNSYPKRLSNQWRLKASSQMVPAILYMVVYMRHTSNLEKAVAFASENLQYPLSLDFRKVFYDLQIGKFSTIKESLDSYLECWRDYSPEFIESFHLIESSLFEPDNARRIQTLEKSLQVILDGVYDKMLKFTHSVRSPLNSVYMLAVVLPVLGIALLPLASAMLGGMLKSSHIFILYNLLIPFIAFFMLNNILLLRPGGYGESGLLEKNPLYSKYKSKKPYFKAFLICLPFFLIGFLPLIFQYTPLPGLLGLQNDYTFAEIGLGFFGDSPIFDFKTVGEGFVGPFGVGALFFGLFIPLGIALFFIIAYKQKTSELIVEREKTRELEREFNNSLFQLGNRLGNGMPPELVFAKVAEASRGLRTEDFFKRINYNIQQMGMSVESAIFDSRRGAIIFYPSDLIATSMKILIESVKKGLNIAAISLMSISQYVKNIRKITNRLKDLLAEVISEMKSNMTFLAPLLLGIVVGLSAMITSILNKLVILQGMGGEGVSQLGGLEGFLDIFNVVNVIPPYYLQIAVGIYLIEVIFILTGALVSIDSGEDKLEKMNKTGKNLKRGVLIYFIVALLATFVLFIISTIVLANLGT